CGGRCVVSTPSQDTCPLRGGVSPVSERQSVVLPTPFRPSTAVTLPRSARSETPCSTWLSPEYVWRAAAPSTSAPHRQRAVRVRAEVDPLHRVVPAHLVARSVRAHPSLVEYGDEFGERTGHVH